MSFDTTASNTGAYNGACVLLEQKLGKELLHLACRHHIYELVLKGVFILCMGPTSGPDILIFKRFQSGWQNINKENYQNGMTDKEVASALLPEKEEILTFVRKMLVQQQPRNDYKEFLELCLIFLG